ncbi:MAG: hypothetical protein R6V12_19620 [Candidatus Hydrogenedentota bacterium]
MRYARAVVLIFILLMSAVFLTGCPPPVADASLQFYNDSSGNDVYAVYLKSVDSDDWGENLITREIRPGNSEIITDLYPGTYNIKVSYETPEGWCFSRVPSTELVLVSREAVEFHFL